MTCAIIVRPLAPRDDMAALTDLIHSAYARHAANNLLFFATRQSVEETARRFSSGHGLVAESGGRLVGTLTVRPPQPDAKVAAYRDPTTWSLCQFAVLPEAQGMGVGHRLHDAAFEYARRHGGRIMALDTAAPATDLIDMYRRWGYTVVGECDWRPQTNYPSVVLTRPITDTLTTHD